MNRDRWRRRWMIVVVVGLISMLGCGEELEGDAPPEGSQLFHHSDACGEGQQRCVIGTTVGQDRPLATRLIAPDDEPVEGAIVEFDLEPRSSETSADLSTEATLTDENGVAEVSFRPDGHAGQFDVTARVPATEGINSLEWQVDVTSKGNASYIIDFDHQGISEIDAVQPLLYDGSLSCDELVEDFFEDHTWPSAGLILDESRVHSDGSIDNASHHPVSDGEQFTVVGLAHRESSALPVDVAFGCTDGAPVSGGADVIVDVQLFDHVAHLGDRYRTTNHLMMTESLPGPVQTIVELLNQLAENPASVLIGGKDYTGLIDDVLFEYLPDSIVENYLEPILGNEAVVTIIHTFINEIIEGLLPGWVDDAQQIVTDVTNVLQEFTVHGYFHFEQEPTLERAADGRTLGHFNDVRHVWDEVVFEWSRECGDPGTPGYEECALAPIDVSQMTTDDSAVIEGRFDATVTGASHLEIERHSMSLSYGVLMVAAFEQLVLKRLFGDDTSSVDELIDISLGDCEELASRVSDEDSSLSDVAEGLCEVLVGQVRDALVDYFADTLDAAGEDQFDLMTPADSPCPLQEPDAYLGSSWPGAPLPYVEMMGQSDDGMGCDWRVEADLPLLSDPAVVDGKFEAEFTE